MASARRMARVGSLAACLLFLLSQLTHAPSAAQTTTIGCQVPDVQVELDESIPPQIIDCDSSPPSEPSNADGLQPTAPDAPTPVINDSRADAAWSVVVPGSAAGPLSQPAVRTQAPTPTQPPATSTPTAGATPRAAQEVYPRSETTVSINRGGHQIQARPVKTVRALDGREAVADRIVVGFGAMASSGQIGATHAAARRYGLQSAHAVLDVTPTEQLIDITGESMAQALAFYRAQPLVRYALPDYMYHVAEVPNDPLFTSQWGMTQIQAPSAWDVTHGSTSILVAIVDSGIYDEASALSRQMEVGGTPICEAR